MNTLISKFNAIFKYQRQKGASLGLLFVNYVTMTCRETVSSMPLFEIIQDIDIKLGNEDNQIIHLICVNFHHRHCVGGHHLGINDTTKRIFGLFLPHPYWKMTYSIRERIAHIASCDFLSGRERAHGLSLSRVTRYDIRDTSSFSYRQSANILILGIQILSG